MRRLLVTKAGDVLVEEVVDKHGGPVVEPVPVNQDDFLEKPELDWSTRRPRHSERQEIRDLA